MNRLLVENDIIEITVKEKDYYGVREAKFFARVTGSEGHKEDRKGRMGQYFGYIPLSLDRGKFGCAWWYEVACPWGIQNVEWLGNEAPKPEAHWYPRPGDRGYDLMC